LERWLTGRKSLVTIPVVLVLIAGSGDGYCGPQPDINAGGTLRIQAQWRKLLPLRAALQNVGIDEQQTQAFSH
jgi:pilus assembly protein HofO